MARPTIRDIARRAGVSAAVVSHVVNDHPGHVGTATRARVRALIAELGYRPLSVAKSLRRRESRTLGLVISNVTSALFAPVARGVDSVAAREGYQVLLVNAESIAAEREAVAALAAHPVDGLIFMSTSVRQSSRHLEDAGTIPVALINRYGVTGGSIRILWDDRAGAQRAIEHLIRLGHARIAIIAGPHNRVSAARRLEGYTVAHRAAGLSLDKCLVVAGDYSFETGVEGVRRLLGCARRPTAILAADDTVAMGVLRGLMEAGLRCPDDVAVVGIGDPPFMAFAAPPLTTVALPIEEAGRRAATRLLGRIRGDAEGGQTEELPCRLIVRESCGAGGGLGTAGAQPQSAPRTASGRSDRLSDARPSGRKPKTDSPYRRVGGAGKPTRARRIP
jgi:LacI family transcriptional regulator